jgi:hypothetical protein
VREGWARAGADSRAAINAKKAARFIGSPWFFCQRHHKKEKIIYPITFSFSPICKRLSAE